MGQAVDPWEFFAARLKELLTASGLSQIKAAELASSRVVSPGSRPVTIKNRQVSAWATCTNRPSLAALRQLVRVLIEHARRIDERLVVEGRQVRPHSAGLLEEARWPNWLLAAQSAAAPAHLPTVRDADPTGLGVHRATANSLDSVLPESHQALLTPYLMREHDRQLRQYLTAAARGGPSVFALLVGESTTGKTRALYEAVLDQAPGHALLHPADAEDLQQLLAEGAIVAGTVLWLNETQRYLQGEAGPAIAKRLIHCLTQVSGVVMVGAMWRTPYFTDLTAQGRTRDLGPTRDLLRDHALLVDVPDALSPAQCDELRALAVSLGERTDSRVIDALDAGSNEDGRVIQHLSGGPELLAAYRNRTLFTPVEHALITAALDARRLGHTQPIPVELLAEAADDHLTARTRPSEADWATTALNDLTCGYRRSDPQDRTDIRHTLTALTRHIARSGTPPSFEPADYLDQHTRHDRHDKPGQPALWHALISHTTDPTDLHRLAQAAQNRGLFKSAVSLYRKAVLAGQPESAADLIQLIASRRLDPDQRAMRWVGTHADLTNPAGIAELLSALAEAGAKEAVQQLLARQPATHADLTDLWDVGRLVSALGKAGAKEAVLQLSARTAQADLTDPADVGHLLSKLREAGAKGAVQQLLARQPARHADLTDGWGVGVLLAALKEGGAKEATQELAARAAADAELSHQNVISLLHGLKEAGAEEAAKQLAARATAVADLTSPDDISSLLSTLTEVGADEAVVQLLAMQPATHTDLTDPWCVARMLSALRRAGADEAVEQLLAMRPTTHVNLTSGWGVARLLAALNEAGVKEAVQQLSARAAAGADLTNPGVTAFFLSELKEVGAEDGVKQLLARHPAAHADLSSPGEIAFLLSELKEVGAEDAMQQLLARQPAAHADLTEPAGVNNLLLELKEAAPEQEQTLLFRAMDAGTAPVDAFPQHGRETDGRAAAPWTWSALHFPA